MTPAPSRPNRFHKPPVNMAAMARRVIARDRGDEPGKLYPDILDGDRHACIATQERLAALLTDRATHHAVQAAQGAGDGSTEDLADALDTLAFTVASTPETAPWIIKLAETEMAIGKLEPSPDILAVLDSCASDRAPIETLVAMLTSTTKPGAKAMPTGFAGRTQPRLAKARLDDAGAKT